MLIKTHLSATFLFSLFFLDKFNTIESKVLFFLVAMVSTYLPDIDSKTSRLGSNIIFRPIQWITGHRKFLHSFTFLILFIPLYYFSKILFYGVILGYVSHLLIDSVTVRGIYPLYPLKFKIRGLFRTGTLSERIFMWVMLILVFYLIYLFYLK